MPHRHWADHRRTETRNGTNKSFSFNLSPQLVIGNSFVGWIQTFAGIHCGEERKEEEEEEKQKQRRKQNNKTTDWSPPRVIGAPGFAARLIIGCGCGCPCGTILPAVALRDRDSEPRWCTGKAALASMSRRGWTLGLGGRKRHNCPTISKAFEGR